MDDAGYTRTLLLDDGGSVTVMCSGDVFELLITDADDGHTHVTMHPGEWVEFREVGAMAFMETRRLRA